MQLMSNPWQQALSGAQPQWEAVILHTGWLALLMATGCAIAAALCWVNGRATRREGGNGGAWFLSAGLLVLIGANELARVDLLMIHLLRGLAHAQGWYVRRREWQLLALGALVMTGLLALGWLRTRLQAEWLRCANTVLGIGLLAGVAVLRAISLHGTDLALNVHLLGLSTGRWLELAGLCLTTVGALRWARTL